jgi:protein-tyrosine kinase
MDGMPPPRLATPRGPVPLTALARAGLVLEHAIRTKAGDEFRIVASRLQATLAAAAASAEMNAHVVMITSTRPGEGKSFCSINLAAALAQLGKRPVVLADVDNKPGCLSDLAGLGAAPGMFELAAEPRLAVPELLLPTELPRLSLLPLGNPEAAQLDGLAPRPLNGAVAAAGSALPEHILLLDAGPCLATSDPSTLAQTAGITVMVVEAEHTQRSEVETALDLVRVCPRIVLMLNKMRARTAGSFGGYGDYGSQYSAYRRTVTPPQQ